MDFSITPEQEALRKEFDDFFREEMKNAPPGWGGSLEDMYSADEGWGFHRYMARKLAEKGWLVRAWPKEYGGQDASIMEQVIFSEVSAYYKAPGVDIFGIGLLGPTLLAVGSEEHKREYLPPISRGETMWCQLWSEPNAGSDLAALASTAKREGDYYILNGQKTWSSGAHRGDWGFGIFRTDPTQKRSRGLSFILLDMKAPGVSVRPLLGMDKTHLFNEVYFDNVRVPVKNRVGEENKGWDVTRAMMNFERTNVGIIFVVKRSLEDLVEFCKETKRNGELLAKNPLIRNKLAQIAVELEVGRALAYRIAWIQEKGGPAAMVQAGALAAASKVYGTELNQRFSYIGHQILGPYGQVKKESKWAPLQGMIESGFQQTQGMCIAMGTSEVQRNTIAWLGLGLPRSWDEVFRRPAAK
jgi:alkylation response protein AidB-like acyl-CoA dehydrogenase